jgi:hypothetical protein
MKNRNKPKISLDQRATYQITVQGRLNDEWSDWIEDLSIETGNDDTGNAITILTGRFDQASLQGLLRRFYSLGIPLVSVTSMDN